MSPKECEFGSPRGATPEGGAARTNPVAVRTATGGGGGKVRRRVTEVVGRRRSRSGGCSTGANLGATEQVVIARGLARGRVCTFPRMGSVAITGYVG